MQTNEVAQHTVTFSSTLNCTLEQAVALFNALCEANNTLIEQNAEVYDNEDQPVSVYVLDAEGHAIY
jgi:hypothetical protein